MRITKNENIPIGLDISDYSLKIIQFEENRRNLKIQAAGKIHLPPELITGGIIKNENEVAKKIKELLDRPNFGAITGNKVVACLPDAKTFIKLINVPKSSNQLTNIIGSEIEKYIPISIKEIFFDWQIIDENREEYSVLIGAAPQTIVNQYLNLLDKSGLSTIALEIESMSICRGLLKEESPNFQGERNNYIIIDIGAARTSLIIYAQKTIVMSISLPISGVEITKRIAKTLEINEKQAEKAKIVCGLDKNKAQGIINNIFDDMIKKINNRLNETLEFYDNHYHSLGKINKIILCGGGANIKNINKIIEKGSGIQTEIGNPFNNIYGNKQKIKLKISEKEKKIEKEKINTAYTTAIGLALRNIFLKK